jgi:hypothetical protein
MKTIRTISKCILAILLVSFMTVACDDMNSIIQEDLDKGEAIYPGKLYALIAYPGIGKVQLQWYLNPDSRVIETVITWKEGGVEKDTVKAVPEGTGIRLDSIEITGLEEGVYSFEAYTVDKEGHRSITTETITPVNIYGNVYTGTLSARGVASMAMQGQGDLVVTWQDVTTENLLYSLVTYFDHRVNSNGVLTTVDTVFNSAATTTLPGLKLLKPFTVKSVYQVGLDTASATGSYYPPVVEKEFLAAQGFTELTAEAATRITSLSFPFMVNDNYTFQDLYYFPNLELLDLTQGTETLPTTTYSRNNVTSTVGGGAWTYLASGFVEEAKINMLPGLLDVNPKLKIKYKPYLYPWFDNALRNYSDRLIIDVPAAPDELLIPYNFLVDYRVQDNTKGATVDFSADGSNVPAEIAAQFPGELKNVYKVTVSAKNSTIAFSLPEGVQFNFTPNANGYGYGIVKADFFIQGKDADTTNYAWMLQGIGQINNYKLLRFNRLPELEAFPDHSPFVITGNQFANSSSYSDAELNPQPDPDDPDKVLLPLWKNFTWDLRPVPREHIRVITIQMGNDDVLWGLPTGKSLTYYIANLRITK